jgi:hypothetical protein
MDLVVRSTGLADRTASRRGRIHIEEVGDMVRKLEKKSDVEEDIVEADEDETPIRACQTW